MHAHHPLLFSATAQHHYKTLLEPYRIIFAINKGKDMLKKDIGIE